jgi:hypothetical protein
MPVVLLHTRTLAVVTTHLTCSPMVLHLQSCEGSLLHMAFAQGSSSPSVLPRDCIAGGLDVDSLVLAPAVLPRSWLQHQALLALQQVGRSH